MRARARPAWVFDWVVFGSWSSASFVLNSASFDVDSGSSLILLASFLSLGLNLSCCYSSTRV